MRSLRAKQTWRLVSLPRGHKPIRCIQEKNRDDSLDKFKAHLVVKGVPKNCVDFTHFLPCHQVLQYLHHLEPIALPDLNNAQFDIKASFLCGFLIEEIFMIKPESFK